jgi:putative ABC transport system permease protein
MSRAFRFAVLSIVRQPVRSALGILGIAAIGALLFDMLLLSRGLVLSFGELLDETGFDVRVLASDAPPGTGPQLTGATALARRLSALPEVDAVLRMRVDDAEAQAGSGRARRITFVGADPRVRSAWKLISGTDLQAAPTGRPVLVVNRHLAARMNVSVGSIVSVRGECESSAAMPAIDFTIVGIAEFPFDSATESTVAGSIDDADRLCGGEDPDRAEMLLVRSRPHAGAIGAAAAIRAAHPALYIVTNEQLVERFSRVEFSYFRQMSTVLSTVTLFFGFLLIAVLLTVSVNQRLGEIAALRAVGLSRARVTAGVLWEAVLLVGLGGALALPLGLALSTWLDRILRTLPGIPVAMHFFVFEPRALAAYLLLLAVASLAAAVYPMRIVATLPIAATLRREVVS